LARFDIANVRIFHEQMARFKAFLAQATPSVEQRLDTDFSMAVAELFALLVYGQLILENVTIYAIDEATVAQIFAVLVRDFSTYALQVVLENSNVAKLASNPYLLVHALPQEDHYDTDDASSGYVYPILVPKSTV
jgi:acyl-CoA dehydrogenase